MLVLRQDGFTDLARKPFESGACRMFIRRLTRVVAACMFAGNHYPL
jgi:hypothetical protein